MSVAAAIPQYKTWPQYVAVLAALLAMFCSGIHTGWTSPSLPRLFTDEYPFDVSSEDGSYIVIIGPVGDIIGNIVASVLVDRIGRKFSILLIGVPQILSMVMIYSSTHSIALLYVARLVGGVAEGACFTILPLYICEVAEPKIRGRLGSSFSLALFFGMLFVNIVGSYVDLYTAALIYISCSLFFMFFFSFMPESPYYLIMRDRTEDARSSLKKLRDCRNVESELCSLMGDVKRQMSEKGRFKDLVAIESNRMAAMVMIMLRILQQASGFLSFNFYAQIFFRDATDAIPEQWAAILMLVIQMVATFVAVLVLDCVGRKPMILLSAGGCFLTLSFNAVFFTLRDFTSLDVSSLSILPLIGLILFIICFALGLGSAVNLMLGELFPASVKAKAAAITNTVFALGMIASTKFYQYMTDNYTIVIPFAVFALSQLVGFLLCLKFVPETKNRTLEQIQQELKGNKHS